MFLDLKVLIPKFLQSWGEGGYFWHNKECQVQLSECRNQRTDPQKNVRTSQLHREITDHHLEMFGLLTLVDGWIVKHWGEKAGPFLRVQV